MKLFLSPLDLSQMNPMGDPPPLLQACPGCAVSLDVSEYEPLQQVICPQCATKIRVERTFHHFQLLEVLGAGGAGTVYKAMDSHLNRPIAFKLLRNELSDQSSFLAKLEAEAKITASINHPHVVRLYSFGHDHGHYYFAMELVDQGTLDDRIETQGKVEENQVLETAIQIAGGLRAAHAMGLIHRDIKPGNILYSDVHNAKLSDFGLAMTTLEARTSEPDEIWGTAYYIAPEKLSNLPEDHRSDIYSLGATLFHALAGRPPYDADNANVVALKHLKAPSISLQTVAPDISARTVSIIDRMLHKDPAQRYQTYDELIEHLQQAFESNSAALDTEGSIPIRWGWILLLIVLLSLIGIGLYFIFTTPG